MLFHPYNALSLLDEDYELARGGKFGSYPHDLSTLPQWPYPTLRTDIPIEQWQMVADNKNHHCIKETFIARGDKSAELLELHIVGAIQTGIPRDTVWQKIKDCAWASSLTRPLFNLHFDKALKPIVLELIASGLTPLEVAHKLLIPESTIKQLRGKDWVSEPKAVKSISEQKALEREERYNKIKELWDQGFSNGEIARMLKISTTIISRHGFPSQPRKKT